jgi:hypothetical protein
MLTVANTMDNMHFLKRIVLLCLFAAVGFAATGAIALLAHGGLRGPGKYCGVVVYDRWDTCFLLSGPYITYVSENVKNELRPYAGKAIQVDASDISQTMNPGDALIRKYKIIGPAPDNHHWATLDGLELLASSDFGPKGSPAFLLEIRNAGNALASIDPEQVAPALLAPVDEKFPLSPSDGRSTAVITRSDLVHHGARQSMADGVARSWSYAVDREIPAPARVQLNPGQSMKVRITFYIPSGSYQFIFGYGGGVHEEMSLASNAVSFDLSENGLATLAN